MLALLFRPSARGLEPVTVKPVARRKKIYPSLQRHVVLAAIRSHYLEDPGNRTTIRNTYRQLLNLLRFTPQQAQALMQRWQQVV